MDFAVGTALVVMGAQGPGGRGLLVAGTLLIASSWLPPWILLGVRYEVAGGGLVVRRGPIARRVPLEAVDEVRIAQPLPGLSGVLLTHHRGARRMTTALYPAEATEFLRQIQLAADHLETTGEGILRRRGAGRGGAPAA